MIKDKGFGNRLIFLRNQRGLKQTQAAQMLDISYSALQIHERGRWPNRNNLKKYVDFYRCDGDWLTTGKGGAAIDNIEVSGRLSEALTPYGIEEDDNTKRDTNGEFVKTINRLLDKIDGLESELKRYREASYLAVEKKS